MYRLTYRNAIVLVGALLCAAATVHAQEPEPIEALYVTGGGWHDYDTQKQIVTEGLSERVNINWTIEYEAGDDSGRWPERFEQDDWLADYDVVVYHFCVTDVPGAEAVEGVVQEHVAHGVPAMFMHCAIHSMRADTTKWFEFGGVRSHRHESKHPYTVEVLEADHPIMQGFPEDGWETPAGELYVIEEVYENTTPLAEAYGEDTEEDHPVIWTNDYEGVRVFGTTIGHHNVTVESPVYLDLIGRGLLWSVDKIEDDGSPAEGYSAADAYAEMIDGERWYRLFDGESLDGWRVNEENPDSFQVEDGRIVVDGPRGHLFYDGPVAEANFKNFHFRAEVYTHPEANSGLFFHTRYQPSGWPAVGYEAQVNATHGDPRKTGSVYSVDDVMNDAPHEDGEWFDYEIIVDGDEITIRIDGETVTRYTEREEDIQGHRRLSSGTFAIQAHDPNSRVYFRNIFVRPIDGEFVGEAPEAGYEVPSDLVNVISPDDEITPLPSDDSPEGEGVGNAIDGNARTKYLNFQGGERASGFEVTLSRPAVVTALRLTSANDAPPRDPAAYRIEAAGEDGRWVEIAGGSLDLFRGRFAKQAVGFENDRAFRRYRVLFPEIQHPGVANSMQVAEVELMGRPEE